MALGRSLALAASFLVLAASAARARAQDGEAAAAGDRRTDAASTTGGAAAGAPGWDALVLSYGGDAPGEVGASARDAATATLEAEGFTVLPEAEIAARIPPARLRDARSIDALRAVGDELGARAVVTVAVWMSDGAPGSVAISIATGGRSFSGTADVESDLAAAAAAAVRAALERQRRALLLDAGTGGSSTRAGTGSRADDGGAEGGERGERLEGDPWSEDGRARAEPARDEGPDELFGIIGPGLLLALGGAGVGLGVYALLDTACTLRGPVTGVCLRGEEPNVALGTLFVIGGALSLTGAIIWWITGAAASPEPRIDVVGLELDVDLHVTGEGALGRVRGRF